MMPILLTGFMFLYVGFPVAAVGSTSLLSKCVSLRVQGFMHYFLLLKLCFNYSKNLHVKGIAQGFRRLATFSGLILGPIWGGATLHQPYLQMSVPLLLLILLGVSFI